MKPLKRIRLIFLWTCLATGAWAQEVPVISKLIEAQHFEEALSRLQSNCAQLPPDSCAYYYGLAFYGTGQYARADSAFQRAVAVRPAWAAAWYAWGVSLYYQNRESEAKEKLSRCLTVDKQHTGAWTALAALALQEGRARRALRFARRAIATDSTYSPAYYNLGLAYLYTGKDSLAAAALKQAVFLRPDWEDPYFSLAELYAAGNMDTTALYWLNRLLTLSPFHVEGLLLRAALHRKQGNQEGACADWQKAMQAGSDEAQSLFERFCP